jgi:hypothetical protein
MYNSICEIEAILLVSYDRILCRATQNPCFHLNAPYVQQNL